ncbi:hypothetical protein [Rhodopseudomonas sp.]|uniref:hypothetical protein n=1 Tax=Rhodopseudomonas sp. TaxID=1078 RepID=UPI003B3A4E07
MGGGRDRIGAGTDLVSSAPAMFRISTTIAQQHFHNVARRRPPLAQRSEDTAALPRHADAIV